MHKERVKIGIIGFGNMGLVIGERLKSKAQAYELSVYDKDKAKTEQISGVTIAGRCSEIARDCDIVLLAVKPQDFDDILKEIKEYSHDRLIISIAAGISTKHIEGVLGDARVVRAMPNMPARIAKGMSCLCKGRFATLEDLTFSKELFDALGETMVLPEEKMDAATAISGSGPGYFFDLIIRENIDIKNKAELEYFARKIFSPALADAAVHIGFSKERAHLLAYWTAEGSLSLLQTTHLFPQELLTQIASKGGTTEAALLVLHKGGALKEAVVAAEKKGKELSR